VPEFQQGEGLEGTAFFRRVREYAERTEDWDYAEAHRLFMAEEQRHARDLGRFLALAGVPLLTSRSWLNRLFCWCGGHAGLELTLMIIAAVEVIAQVYYGALLRATGSPILGRICARILRDEKAHVRFQCERLAILRRGRAGWLLSLSHLIDLVLFVLAGLACWWGHRRVLRAGGLTWRAYWREAGRCRRRADRLKDPRTYLWDPEGREWQ
jgi:hypothetical protein